MASILVDAERSDPFDISEALFPAGTPVALKAGDTFVFNHGGASLRVFDRSGGFVYDSLAAFGPWEQWQGGTMHAGQLMQEYVERTGGFPW